MHLSSSLPLLRYHCLERACLIVALHSAEAVIDDADATAMRRQTSPPLSLSSSIAPAPGHVPTGKIHKASLRSSSTAETVVRARAKCVVSSTVTTNQSYRTSLQFRGPAQAAAGTSFFVIENAIAYRIWHAEVAWGVKSFSRLRACLGRPEEPTAGPVPPYSSPQTVHLSPRELLRCQ